MNTKFLIFVIGFSVVLTFGQIARMQGVEEQSLLELKLTAPKQHFLIGEVTKLNFEVINKTDDPVTLMNTLSPKSGYLNVAISKGGYDNFNQYSGAGWGKSDAFNGNIRIEPKESITNSAYVFWNSKPNISESIAPEVIKRATEGKILTSYAFPEAGDYYVKATYVIYLVSRSTPVLLESEPIKLTIEAPVGEDLEVWNKIKDDGDFAYFIQEGDIRIPSHKPEEREKFLNKVEEIITLFPNSFYAESLRQSLAKFRADEAKRQESIQKLKPKHPQ
jgi:hypothetical protein